MDSKIWKYKKDGSIKGLFQLSGIGFQLCGIVVIILAVVAMTFLEIFLQKNIGEGTALSVAQWGIALACFGIPALYFFFVFRMSARVSAMQLAFVKDEEGSLYVFDYRSQIMQSYAAGCGMAVQPIISGNALRQAIANWQNSRNMARFIDLLDKSRMIEGLLAQKRLLTYGKKIALVKLIEEKGSICRLYCILEDREGRREHKELVLSKSYEDYEGLLHECRKLENPLSKESVRYCPFCGSMLVGDICPKCQPGSLPAGATKGDKWRMWDPKLKILNLVLYGLAVLSLIGCIAVRVYADTKAEYSYEEVTAVVTDHQRSTYKGRTSVEVTVAYQGQLYRLINVKSGGAPYMVGYTTQAYLSDGKMYANIDGIKSKSVWGKRYFLLLGSTVLLGFLAVVLTAVRKDMKMKE